jgi:WXG100 family type VII secretion target
MGYHVDLPLLQSVVSELDLAQARLERQLAELDRIVDSPASVWTGQAATAHRDAHSTWASEARQMHRALTVMHQASRTAHENYTEAGATNVRMWEQLR